ncbi:MAG TPA: hypothetical protein VFB81_13760 [Myxococcales bacterium]|nr:hypothetical protein [Myxococcales bacterium]
MDPFVQRLIKRLHHPSQPLSRNRHFATFDTPEGRMALRISRRLKSLQKDILQCLGEGGQVCFARREGTDGQEGEHRIELTLRRLRGRRVSMLVGAEFELLRDLPGINDALREVPASEQATEADVEPAPPRARTGS